MASVTDDYVSFFLTFNLGNLWQLFLLGLGRVVPIVAIAPFFGGKILPDSAKLIFSALLVPIFLPYILMHSAGPLPFDLIFLLLMVKEVMIGFFLAIAVAIPFWYCQGAGTLIDHQRGVQSLQVQDPAMSSQVSPTGLLYNNMFLVIFFIMGGPLMLFEGVFTSYTIMPADTFLPSAFYSLDQPFFHLFVKALNTILKVAAQLSAPSLITILLSDLFLGITNRMAPQVQITFLLWSLKAFFGIAILWAAWWFILKQLDIFAVSWMKMLAKLLHQVGEYLSIIGPG